MEAGAGVSSILPYVNAFALLSLLGLCARFFVQNRRLKLQEKSEDRGGFGVLIEALQSDVRNVRAAHQECEAKVRKLQNDFDGLTRQFITYQLAVARAVPPNRRTPEIEAMLRNLRQLSGDD